MSLNRIRGEIGELAERLSIPARTWENYEAGVTMPAEIAFDFFAITRANPHWLGTGQGERYVGP